VGYFDIEVSRLQVVSNFGDSDCGAGEIHMHAREISRTRDDSSKFRALVRVSRLPHKLETTRSLMLER